MFSPKTRLIVIIGCLLLGSFSIYNGKLVATAVALIVILFTLYGYFRQGTVYMAFKLLQQGKNDLAETTLLQTKKVNWLSKTQRAYYHFVKAFIDMAKGRVEESKDGFQEALNIGLKLKNDTGLAYANLASLNHRTKNKVKAREYIEKAKKVKVKKEVKLEIERLEVMIG